MKIKDILTASGLTADDLRDDIPKRLASEREDTNVYYFISGKEKSVFSKEGLEDLMEYLARVDPDGIVENIYIYNGVN